VLSPAGTAATLMERWTSGTSVLGDAFQRYAPGAIEIPIDYPPSDAALRDVERAIDRARVVVLATQNAVLDPSQVHLAEIVRARAPAARLVGVALRTPYDLLRLPWLDTFVCAYTSVEPSVLALVDVLFGETPAVGRLPVELPGLYPRGHALTHS